METAVDNSNENQCQRFAFKKRRALMWAGLEEQSIGTPVLLLLQGRVFSSEIQASCIFSSGNDLVLAKHKWRFMEIHRVNSWAVLL